MCIRDSPCGIIVSYIFYKKNVKISIFFITSDSLFVPVFPHVLKLHPGLFAARGGDFVFGKNDSLDIFHIEKFPVCTSKFVVPDLQILKMCIRDRNVEACIALLDALYLDDIDLCLLYTS